MSAEHFLTVWEQVADKVKLEIKEELKSRDCKRDCAEVREVRQQLIDDHEILVEIRDTVKSHDDGFKKMLWAALLAALAFIGTLAVLFIKLN